MLPVALTWLPGAAWGRGGAGCMAGAAGGILLASCSMSSLDGLSWASQGLIRLVPRTLQAAQSELNFVSNAGKAHML